MTHEPFIVITAPRFTAGIGFSQGKAVELPTRIDFMLGWTPGKIEAYATQKGWKFEWINPKETEDGR